MTIHKQFVIACGGTGGHLFPGMAVAEVLYEHGHDILLLVSEKEIDTIALRHHFEFRTEKLPSIGMPPILSPKIFRFLKRELESFITCRQIYATYQPVAVLGMGGFISVAPLLAARMSRIPCFLHESNAIAGRANRFVSHWVNRIFLGITSCESSFPNKNCMVTGTPVRKELNNIIAKNEVRSSFGLNPDFPTLLVMGGSQGSDGINQLLFKAVSYLKNFRDKQGRPLQIIHLTGDRDDTLAAINYQREGILAYVVPFHHRMAEVYSASDLVVSRAGAASLSELSQFGLPSVLIPFPFAAENHQYRNAELCYVAKAAELIEEKNANPELFALLIANLMADDCRRKEMSESMKTMFMHGGAENIAKVLEEVAL